ncbi:DUF4232 domain-containing protein [Streptomyces sp. NBC_00414]|uniref:DUF4232 domain-containing protein n=1 Tax=Streptomyces sp. NBC_00414 TaxID=2975739 RepID=UPI002E1AABE1
MSARTHRTRLLAAALTVATLSLTACDNGEGIREEGMSADRSSTAPSSKESERTSDDKDQADPVGSSAEGDKGSSTTKAPSTSKKTKNTNRNTATLTPCTDIRTAATVVSRPLNHLLLTVTNTGSKNCDLTGYPAVRLGAAQSVPPAFEDSKPQAVVTLAPGESGYAGVLLSAADGSGSDGYTAKSLTFYLDAASQTPARPSLPAKGVYVDDSVRVSYWQAAMGDALSW